MSRKTKRARLDWHLLPKQDNFVRSAAREVLYSGAFGAGKSRAVAMKLVARAVRPGAIEGLCRKHLSILRMTTLRTLLEAEGGAPPVLPQGTYRHHLTERRIRIVGGGTIQYFGLGDSAAEDRQKISSLTLSGCAVDQAEELSEREWTTIRGRIRLEADGLPRQIYAACNPASPSHHLAVRFGLDGESTPRRGCEAIVTRSSDNTYLPEDYLADLETFTGLARARYVEGRWVGSEGLVYDRWDRRLNVRERPHGPWARRIVGQDEGYTNPAAMVYVLQDESGRVHVADEWYKTRQLETNVVRQAEAWRDEYGPEVFVLDPSAAKLREAMRVAGLFVEDANNDVFGGIQAVQKRLAIGDDGRPLLTVDPRCTNLIREFETYEWMLDRDKPRKAFDHALDALRYAIMSYDGAVAPMLTAVSLADDPISQDDWMDNPEMWQEY